MPAESFEHRRRGDLLARCLRVECVAGLWSVHLLVYATDTGLFRVRLGGQAVSDRCLSMVIISSSLLLACVDVCCCSPYCMSIFEAEVYDECSNDEENCALCYALECEGGRKGRPTSGPLLPEPGGCQWPDIRQEREA